MHDACEMVKSAIFTTPVTTKKGQVRQADHKHTQLIVTHSFFHLLQSSVTLSRKCVWAEPHLRRVSKTIWGKASAVPPWSQEYHSFGEAVRTTLPREVESKPRKILRIQNTFFFSYRFFLTKISPNGDTLTKNCHTLRNKSYDKDKDRTSDYIFPLPKPALALSFGGKRKCSARLGRARRHYGLYLCFESPDSNSVDRKMFVIDDLRVKHNIWVTMTAFWNGE